MSGYTVINMIILNRVMYGIGDVINMIILNKVMYGIGDRDVLCKEF